MLGRFLSGAKIVSSPVLSFQEGRTDLANATQYTFTNVSLGNAAANRYIVVVFNERGSSPDPTVTVAGQSCTNYLTISNATTSFANIFVTDSPVTSGTSGTIVINNTNTRTAIRMSVYALYASSPVPSYSDSFDPVISTNPSTVTSTLQNGQVGIAYGQANTTSSLTSFTVTGPITLDYQSGIAEFADMITGTLTGSGTVTFTTAGTGSNTRALLAIWG